MKTLTLIAPHEHAGQPYPAGATLEVDDATAAWLIAAGVVTPAGIPDADITSDDSPPAGDPPAPKKGKRT